MSALEPLMTRRGFIKTGGVLVVTVALPAPFRSGSTVEAAPVSPDPSKLASWLEIRADNTIIARTGKTEIGTGMSAFYAQMVAEELNVPFESVSLVMGHTDETPDGGYSAGLLGGAANLRKVAAYAYQALLGLAASRLDVPIASLTVQDGVVKGGTRSISYGDLVLGQRLELTIPVTGTFPRIDPKENTGMSGLTGIAVSGNPPLKPAEEHRIIGTSYPMPGVVEKVTGRAVWSGDVRLPEMLHARMIRPASLGSSVVSVGALDRKRFPTAEVVRKGNLVAVVSPSEWEAITASRAVAANTKWTTDWAGLPGSENLPAALRELARGARPTATKGTGTVDSSSTVRKVIEATYTQSYVRHAPIGPYLAVADVRRDGSATVWTHSSQSQGLRTHIAHMLGTPAEQVVVRWLPQSGQYGRTTRGGDGAEADAVILSQLLGKPVRVQWMLEEDLAWSSVSPGWIADAKAGLDANGRLVTLQYNWYSPNDNDARAVGALLAGVPTLTANDAAAIRTVFPYDAVPNVREQAFGLPQLAADAPVSGGLRGNIMRTPLQRMQNFVLESLINEAAAAAGADALQFRIDHTTSERLIAVLKATAEAAGWTPRKAPRSDARRTGGRSVRGRGAAVIIRGGAYWVGIADVEVNPATGRVTVPTFTVGVELGKVINPRHLQRVVTGGIAMGLGEALTEEVTFDNKRITSTDWKHYRIPTMEEMPEVKFVSLPGDNKAFGTGGEAPNALVPPAVAAAIFDATGIMPRRLPFTAARIAALMRA